MGWSHPDVGMRSIFDLRPYRKALQFRRQNIKHSLPRDESSSAQGNLELITSAIVISTNLLGSLRDIDGIQGRDFGRVEIVQGCIDMPAIEPSDTFGLVICRNPGFVECSVARMFQSGFSETFVVVDDTIADKLHLGYRRDSLEIGMKNRSLGLASLIIPVAITFRFGIKRLSKQDELSIFNCRLTRKM
jgi:hypothetical protein